MFSLALATLGTSTSARRLLYASMGIATAIALVGNVQVTLTVHAESLFAWLEAIAPPPLLRIHREGTHRPAPASGTLEPGWLCQHSTTESLACVAAAGRFPLLRREGTACGSCVAPRT